MVLNFNEIKDKIESGVAKPAKATFSNAKSYIVDLDDGTSIFYKQYADPSSQKTVGGVSQENVSEADKKKLKFMIYSMPATCYLNPWVSEQRKISEEVISTLRWSGLNVPSQELLYYDGKYTLIFKKMNGVSLEEYIDGKPHDAYKFKMLLDSFDSLRYLARMEDDTRLMHPDPYANNFFHNYDTNKIVPFDAAKVIRTGAEMNFDEFDARLNLFFLTKLFHLKVDDKTRNKYLEQSVKRLGSDERKYISKLYTPSPKHEEYFETVKPKGKEVVEIYYRNDVRDEILDALNIK